MKTNERQNLILEGPMMKAILTLSIPLMINNLIQTVYNLADALWLGRLGATEFASTTFVWPVIFLFITLGSGVAVAGTSIMSQLIGSGRHGEAESYAHQLLDIAIVLAVCISTLGYFATPYIVSMMGATDKLREFSNTYLSITFLGYPAVVLAFAMQSILQSQGDTKSITMISGVSAISNIVLDPIFIFNTIPETSIKGLGLGVAGAAYATIISQYILVFLGTFIIIKKSSKIKFKMSKLKPDTRRLKKLIKIGIPSVVGQSGTSIGFLVMNVFITSYGTDALAAYGMVNRITGLLMQPVMGIGAAIASIIGQNMGAMNVDRARECFKKSQILSFAINTVGALTMLIFARQLVVLFVKSEDAATLMPYAMEYMIYSLAIMPMMGAFNVLHGFFQGTGHTDYGMKMSLYRLWLIRVPVIIVLKYFTPLGPTGIWISMLLSNLLADVYGFYLYRQDRWMVRMV